MATSRRPVLSPGVDFATGVCRYSDFYPGLEEPLARIYVPFRPQGMKSSYLALLDTGAHFCILSPELMEALGDGWTAGKPTTSLLTANGRIHGRLVRHGIRFLAERGEDLEIEATVFVTRDWYRPSVIGYTGVLERMRLALDPQLNLLYFGPPG